MATFAVVYFPVQVAGYTQNNANRKWGSNEDSVASNRNTWRGQRPLQSLPGLCIAPFVQWSVHRCARNRAQHNPVLMRISLFVFLHLSTVTTFITKLSRQFSALSTSIYILGIIIIML
jgi:hypothetical protein